MTTQTLAGLEKDMMPLPGHVLVGLSGGSDSVALLRLALLRREAGGVRVEAVHVNHGLRGGDSDGDEAFVRALCAESNVPLRLYRLTPPAHPGEGWARDERYARFTLAMAESGADALLLAHQKEDQAETLLLHLLRGAGLEGLSGMAEESRQGELRILRPLLRFSRSELREALTACGQAWREDLSNADPRYLRNAVRLELLPLMERLSPGAAARLAGTAAILRGDAETLDAMADELLRSAGRDWLPLSVLLPLSAGQRARVARRWWQRFAAGRFAERSLSREQTAGLLALLAAGAGTRCNLPGGCHGERGWRFLHLREAGGSPAPTAVDMTERGASLGVCALHVLPMNGRNGDGKWTQEAPRGLLAGCRLRTRRPGDWLMPFGSGHRQSLQDYFVNRRVDAAFRDRVPLLCRESEVLLAGGVGAGNVPVWDGKTDVVLLRWTGEMPWALEKDGK